MKTPFNKIKICFWLLTLFVSGCTVTKIKTPYWEMERSSFMQKMDIGKVIIMTNGTGTLEGYKNDGGTEILSAITSAAIEAAVKSAK